MERAVGAVAKWLDTFWNGEWCLFPRAFVVYLISVFALCNINPAWSGMNLSMMTAVALLGSIHFVVVYAIVDTKFRKKHLK